MPTKTKVKKSAKNNKNNKSVMSVLLVAVCVIVLAVLGYTFLKNYTSFFNNDSAQAEEKASPEQLAYTPAEQAAADAEPEAGIVTVFSNYQNVTAKACRYHAGGFWRVRVVASKSTNSARTLDVYNVSRGTRFLRMVLYRDSRAFEPQYGTATTGYIKFVIAETRAQKMFKFKTLQIC